MVCGASYHIFGSCIYLQDTKIRFQLLDESYISDRLFSESRLLASYVSRHKAMAYDIYESLEGSRATFRWCWQVCELDLRMVCPYPGIRGSPRRGPESVTRGPKRYTSFKDWLSETYGMTYMAHQGVVHDYLGMIFNFSVKEKVMINMIEYIKNIIANFPEEIVAIRTSPVTDHLITVRNKSLVKLLPGEQTRAFHHASAQLLFLSTRARLDIQPATAFLSTRVRCPDEDD